MALGVFSGIAVFDSLPEGIAARAQAAALGRFDGVALGCAAALLASEMARSALALRLRRSTMGRLRRLCAFGLGIAAVYLALVVSPASAELRTSGVVPGVGPRGMELERLEQRGLMVRRFVIPIAALLVLLHVWSTRSGREREVVRDRAPLPNQANSDAEPGPDDERDGPRGGAEQRSGPS